MPLANKFQVSMTSIMLIMIVCTFYIQCNGDEQTTDPWLAVIFSTLCLPTFITSRPCIPRPCKLS